MTECEMTEWVEAFSLRSTCMSMFQHEIPGEGRYWEVIEIFQSMEDAIIHHDIFQHVKTRRAQWNQHKTSESLLSSK